ncbi:hypothetical protein WN990_22760 [Kitasatospora purpeofusca]|uniref:hypothetical protein n=1 Tax=Kitasatospora purpeofusca TaxID=67352 RepID=UPI0030F2D0ED
MMSSFVDDGMPRSREDWPTGHLDALKPFVQGDVIPCPPLVYHASPSAAVTRSARLYADEPEDELSVLVREEMSPRWALITSGTCDIAEEDAKPPRKPFVQIAPIVDMSDMGGGDKKLVRKGRFNYLLHVPGLSELEAGFWVADLRYEYPVEKGWLAQQDRIKGFPSEGAQEVVAQAVSWLRQRPAMGSSFIQLLIIPLREALAQLRQEDPALADQIDDQIKEWAVRVDSRLEPSRIEPVLLSDGEDASEPVVEWWRAFVDSIRQQASDQEAGVSILAARFERLDRMTVSDFRTLVPMAPPHSKFSNE